MMENKICANCGYFGKPKKVVNGGCLIEGVLWLFFIIPGLIYSLWRLTSKFTACPECGAPNMITIDSPRGKQLIKQYKVNLKGSRAPESALENYLEKHKYTVPK